MLQDYDLVFLDTPPALGYLTINGLSAADILLVPFGASFLEIDSTGRFFDMLHATFASIEAAEGVRFEWDAVRCLLTRYDAAQQAELAALAEGWFGPLMARTRLEATALAPQAGEQAAPIHAADPADFNPATYRRGRAAFEAVWAEIRPLVEAAWARDLAETDPGFAGETP
jgi:chromosome partitioning protein